MAEKKDDFYKDLDRSSVKKSYCSCLSFAVLFIFALVLIEVVLFWSAKSLRSNPVTPDMIKGIKLTQGTDSFSKNQVNDKETTVSISQGTLCAKIVEANKGREISCVITPDGIELSGKFSSLGFQNTKVVIVPYVEKEQLKFRVSDARVGNFKVPDVIGTGAAGLLNKTIKNNLPDLKDASVKSVELQDGVMIIGLKKL